MITSPPVENCDHLLTGGHLPADICTGKVVHMARHFAALGEHPELSAWCEHFSTKMRCS